MCDIMRSEIWPITGIEEFSALWSVQDITDLNMTVLVFWNLSDVVLKNG